MFLTEVFRGRYVPMPAGHRVPERSSLNELMIVGPIKVRSACSHHLCPILGRVWIGILPNEHSNLIGLSKYARICDWVMSRPQIQEEAVTMLANDSAGPRQARRPGDRDGGRSLLHALARREGRRFAMTNSVMRGAFLKDPNLRREFLSLRLLYEPGARQEEDLRSCWRADACRSMRCTTTLQPIPATTTW
jgi:GTP cyclohydrolase I